MPIVRVSTHAEAEAIIAEHVSKRQSALFLFFGTEDPQTGDSWCPDCVIAHPGVRAAARKLRPELVLYELPVGARSDWRGESGKSNPYRVDERFRIECVPTLCRCEAGAVPAGAPRLVEEQLVDEKALEAFLKQ
eukprot:m51a1_g3752 hypothetical protein (134) ;mRNA; r:76882-77283